MLTVCQKKENILRGKENSKWNQADFLKRGKTRVTKSWIALILHLIGGERGASFLDQSQSNVKQTHAIPVTFDTVKTAVTHVILS